jgi:redox-regulated HSP33 family molecular chaperone
VDELKVGGKLSVTCEFCNSSYDFDEQELAALRRPEA